MTCVAPRADRGDDRELQVGRVLVGRVTLHDRARGDRGRDRGGIGGVEIADDEVDREAEHRRVVQTRVGRDHNRRVGQDVSDMGLDGIAAREHDGAFHAHPSLRRHYPEQVRGVGDGRRVAHRATRP